MTEIKLFEVGGCVRDELLSIPSKDIDFVVIAPSFEDMVAHLKGEGFKVFLEQPEFGTIRCSVPKGHALHDRTHVADFVLARKDGPSTDGRRPDFVEPGTLLDDLSRRDFTMNAIARDPFTGELIDPFDGIKDLRHGTLRFVGDPVDRIKEDGLRVLRGFRFLITKDLKAEDVTHWAIRADFAAAMLACVSVERIRDELEKMFKHDTLKALHLMGSQSPTMLKAIFRDNLRLGATLRLK